MNEGAILFLASHVLVGFCCLWMAGMIIRMLRIRPEMFIHPWAMLPVILWLVAKAVTHTGYVFIMLTNKGHTTVVGLMMLNAVAAFLACIAVRFVFVASVTQPTIKELKTVTNSLAKALGESLTEKEQ